MSKQSYPLELHVLVDTDDPTCPDNWETILNAYLLQTEWKIEKLPWVRAIA